MYLFSAFALIASLISTSSATPSSACSVPHQYHYTSGSSSQNFSFYSAAGGGQREYLLHLPEKYDGKTPLSLILAFHGKQQSPETFEWETSLSDGKVNGETIVVYPRGIKQQWTGDPEAPPTSEINDMLMVSELITHLTNTLCFSTISIHAYGFSNGGGLVDLLACNPITSRQIASFAATSAAVYLDSSLPEPLFGTCTSRNAPVPMLAFHGTKDPVIHYDGKGTSDGETYAVEQRARQWSEKNGCAGDARNKTTELFEGQVRRYSFSCQGFEDVVALYRIEGFGHGVPTTTPLDNDDQRHGPTYFNATPIILDFFKVWPLPELEPEAVKDEL